MKYSNTITFSTSSPSPCCVLRILDLPVLPRVRVFHAYTLNNLAEQGC
jgi:hypothetical protein